jgi:hypothetical protein
MSRYTLADRLIGYRSATPLAYNQFGAKPAPDPNATRPAPPSCWTSTGMHPLPPAGDPDAAEPLHAGRLDGPAARVVGRMSRPEFEISTDWTGHAKPGHWYGRYYADWEAAHPGAWVRGELVPGGFYNGNRWGGSTLSWDANWFSKHGAKMPKGVHYVAPGRSMTRLTEKLNPSDSGVMRLQFRDD